MDSRLKNLLCSVFNVDPDTIREDSSPATLPQWNSLAHVTMVAAVEQEFDVQFEMKEILGIKSLADLTRLLAAKGRPQ
ncbi:MAG: acyl carrier protein [bacterium]